MEALKALCSKGLIVGEFYSDDILMIKRVNMTFFIWSIQKLLIF